MKWLILQGVPVISKKRKPKEILKESFKKRFDLVE
jgi:hypothetical protein